MRSLPSTRLLHPGKQLLAGALGGGSAGRKDGGEVGEFPIIVGSSVPAQGKVIFIVITTQPLLNFQLKIKFYHSHARSEDRQERAVMRHPLKSANSSRDILTII